MARPSSRERILDAFEALVIERGATSAPLEIVAEQAGVSKGGLLYHFPAKNDLADGLVDRLTARIDAAVATAPDEPADLIRWYLTYDPDDPVEHALWRSLVAAMHAVDDTLAQSITSAVNRYTRALARLEPTLCEHVRLVGDGLYLNALIGAPAIDGERLDAIIADLQARI